MVHASSQIGHRCSILGTLCSQSTDHMLFRRLKSLVYNGKAMCGRYSLTTGMHGLDERFTFRGEGLSFEPRYNIAPTQSVLAVVNDGKSNRPEMMRWGLIPFWAKDVKISNRMINARSETVPTSSAFKRPFQKKRRLVIADGFYEWKKVRKQRIPMYVALKGGEPFGFAGLWESWKSPDGEWIQSCTIITTTPNTLVEPIHDRMPVILPQEAEHIWLNPTIEEPEVLTSLLIPFPGEAMEAYEVSPVVNSVRNEGPECIVRLSA